MVQKTRVPARRFAKAMAWLAPIGLVAGLAGACSELRSSLGDDCLKNEDCLSGICSQSRCTASPPLLGAEGTPTAVDAGADSATLGDGTTPAADAMGQQETSVTAPDAPITEDSATVPDAPPDAIDQGTPDASGDGSTDVPVDARADGGEPG
ncbi:MAG TPA: hypothetical protein VH044_14770 [Polyangiaceae bacterium]|jgi:hypothetical protein|nr:hypothetical protein [Polyangiaceae bacterium]